MLKNFHRFKAIPFFSQKTFTTFGIGKGKNMMRDPKEVMDNLVQTAKEMHSHYGAPKKLFESRAGNKMEFWAKKTRQMYLLAGCFQSQKHIIPVKRIRHPDDTMEKLRKNKEIACVVEGREEFKDFNFVVDLNLVNNIDKKNHYKVKPYYIKYNGEEIRCIIQNYDRHLYHKFLRKVHFQRYIPGRPNLLTLPIEIIAEDKNHYIREFDSDSSQNIESIDVWCFNETYLPIIEIDARLISPSKCFRIADLEEMLPDGMYLHRKYDNIRHQSIFSITETWNQVIASTKTSLDGLEYNQYSMEEKKKTEEEEKDEEAEEDFRMNMKLEKQLKMKELEKSKKYSTMPLRLASSKKLNQIKSTGADAKALRENQKSKALGLKKEEKKAKPKKVEEAEEADK